VVQSSGVKEWSDGEVARLRTAWVKAFLRRHVHRCALLVLLYLLGVAFLGASVERYWHWIRTLEAQAGAPIKTVNQWKATCVVRPWLKGCRPAPAAAGAQLAAARQGQLLEAAGRMQELPPSLAEY